MIRVILIAALLSQAVQAQEAMPTQKPAVYVVDQAARISVGFNDPIDLDIPSYVFNKAAFDAVGAELQRLQYIEEHPPTVDIPVKGWLVGIAIAGVVCLAGGLVLGFTLGKAQ